MSERLYVAIDGGNSKTHVVVGSTDGRLHGFVRGPGSSPHMIGVAGTVALLDSLVRQAVAQANLPVGMALSRAEVYIAGADLPVEVDVLMKAVGEAGWASEHRVDNDLFALLRAGTSVPDAVAVVCGAGINCVGRAADGRTARFPALGDLSGDWGGGQHLARLALWHAARGEDIGGPVAAAAGARFRISIGDFIRFCALHRHYQVVSGQYTIVGVPLGLPSSEQDAHKKTPEHIYSRN